MMKKNLLEKRTDYLKNFIKESVYNADKDGIVIGLSGGLDSSTCLFIASVALGAENCLALYMPHRSSPAPRDEVNILRRKLKFKLKTYDLSPITEIFSEMTEISEDIQKGNFGARLRTAFLYQQAASNNYLVLNTSNRSEIMTGYFTKWGDEAGDISPMAEYYKSEVREIAEYLKLPSQILNAAPSADFFEGQKDEEELGISYSRLDKILRQIESGSTDYGDRDKPETAKVAKLIDKSRHKRNSPLRARRIN